MIFSLTTINIQTQPTTKPQPILYIFVGYPGSGKTTLAQYIEKRTGAIHIWSDRIRQQLFINPNHSLAETTELFNKLNQLVEEILKLKISVIYDTNFNHYQDRQLMRQLAEKYQANCRLIYLKTDRQIAKTRATAQSHACHNGYNEIMSEQTFNHLSNHTEVPQTDEQPITISGDTFNFHQIDQLLAI